MFYTILVSPLFYDIPSCLPLLPFPNAELNLILPLISSGVTSPPGPQRRTSYVYSINPMSPLPSVTLSLVVTHASVELVKILS